MSGSESGLICVTNRTLCCDSFLERLEQIAAAHPKRIILREKELPALELKALWEQCVERCSRYDVPLTVNSPWASSLGTDNLHMPFQVFQGQGRQNSHSTVKNVGVSIHSPQEAQQAAALGADYLIAGHIFATDCKRGLEPRGLEFLRQVCEASGPVPVYAIGGITPERVPLVLEAGAAGVCVMSRLMTCENPRTEAEEFQRYL